jgi:hypothetical protein
MSGTGNIFRRTTECLLGDYGSELVRVVNGYARQSIAGVKGLDYWTGRTFSMGVWLAGNGTNRLRGSVSFNFSTFYYTAMHSGNGEWEFLTTTRTALSSGLTSVQVAAQVLTSDGTHQFAMALCNGEEWSAEWIKLHKANVLSADHEQTWSGEAADLASLDSIAQSQVSVSMGDITQAFPLTLAETISQKQTIDLMGILLQHFPLTLNALLQKQSLTTMGDLLQAFSVVFSSMSQKQIMDLMGDIQQHFPLEMNRIIQTQNISSMGELTQAFEMLLWEIIFQKQSLSEIALDYLTEPIFILSSRKRTKVSRPRKRLRIFQVKKGNTR